MLARFSLRGSGPGCPLLRASDEHILIVRVLRARRAPGRSLTLLPKYFLEVYPNPVHQVHWTYINGVLDSVMEPVVDLEGRRVAQQGRFVVRPKILIIDDSVDSWNLLSTIVKTHNFYPVWAADGMQAMAAARFHHPQAILLDIGLPGGDGFVVLERLKSNSLLSDIPVIVVTVRDRQEVEENARRLGAAAYLSKPVQVDALMESLQSVLATQEGIPAGVTG